MHVGRSPPLAGVPRRHRALPPRRRLIRLSDRAELLLGPGELALQLPGLRGPMPIDVNALDPAAVLIPGTQVKAADVRNWSAIGHAELMLSRSGITASTFQDVPGALRTVALQVNDDASRPNTPGLFTVESNYGFTSRGTRFVPGQLYSLTQTLKDHFRFLHALACVVKQQTGAESTDAQRWQFFVPHDELRLLLHDW